MEQVDEVTSIGGMMPYYTDYYEDFCKLRNTVEDIIEGVKSGDINFEAAIEKLEEAVS